jgi:hypothetical protein
VADWDMDQVHPHLYLSAFYFIFYLNF